MEFPEISEQYIHRIGRTGRADKTGIAISFISPKEVEIQIEAEVLMEKEITFLPLPKNVEISEKLFPFEKEKKEAKFMMKKPKLEGGEAFHEKSKKNKKINLGGPSKTKKKVSTSVNRNILKTRDKKRKDKN
jgi:ATP-dependent RNA helicase RhlE